MGCPSLPCLPKGFSRRLLDKHIPLLGSHLPLPSSGGFCCFLTPAGMGPRGGAGTEPEKLFQPPLSPAPISREGRGAGQGGEGSLASGCVQGKGLTVLSPLHAGLLDCFLSFVFVTPGDWEIISVCLLVFQVRRLRSRGVRCLTRGSYRM